MERGTGSGGQDRTVVFVHIPKTAGTTLACILYRHYSHDRIFFFGCWPEIGEGLRQYRRLPPSAKTRYRVFLGHQPFGLHEYVPKPVKYMTLLRDPVERVISHYYHRYRKKHPNDPQSIYQPLVSLEDYVVSEPFWHNWQCKFLHGPADVFATNGSCPKTIDTVKRNIEEHSVMVGLTERFDESLVLFKMALGWGAPCYTRMNIGNGRPRKQDLSGNVVKAIEQANELDMELYRFAEKRFEEQIGLAGPLFNQELSRFRQVQERYVRHESAQREAVADITSAGFRRFGFGNRKDGAVPRNLWRWQE